MPFYYRGVVRATLNMTLGSKAVSCYFAYKNATEDVPTQFECQQIAETVANSWATNIGLHLSNELFFTSVTARGMSSDFEQQYNHPLPANTKGGVISPAMPRNVAFVMQRSTGLTGRKGRGRIYIPGIAESQVANSEIDSGTPAAIRTKLNIMDNDVEALTGYSAVTLGTEPVNGGLGIVFYKSYLVEGWRYVDLRVDTRRKRL